AEPRRCRRRRTARRDGRAPDPHRAAVRRHPQGHPAGPADRRGSRDFVRSRHCAAAVALVVLAATGCGAETPDYHSVWSTSSTTPPPTTTAAPVPIGKFLEGAGVTGEPIAPDKLTDLKVT